MLLNELSLDYKYIEMKNHWPWALLLLDPLSSPEICVWYEYEPTIPLGLNLGTEEDRGEIRASVTTEQQPMFHL